MDIFMFANVTDLTSQCICMLKHFSIKRSPFKSKAGATLFTVNAVSRHFDF